MADQDIKVVLIGLDGADYELVTELMQAGKMPNLRRLVEQGVFQPLLSSIQPITPVAWNTIYTGRNPGKHGVHDFGGNERRGEAGLLSSRSRKSAPFWRYLNDAGIRTVLVNLPICFPAEPVDGALVSGYGGPEESDVSPPKIKAAFREAFPNYAHSYHPMKHKYWEDFPGYVDKLCRLACEHTNATLFLVEKTRPELVMVVIPFSDEICHLGYQYHDGSHPAYQPPGVAGDPIVKMYQHLDAEIGKLLESIARHCATPPTVLVISDHGSQPIHKICKLNRWLHERGYLHFRRKWLENLRVGWLGRRLAGKLQNFLGRIARRLERSGRYWMVEKLIPRFCFASNPRFSMDAVDWTRTTAYGTGTYGQLWIAESITHAAEKDQLVRCLQLDLAELKDERGQPLFDVYLPSQIYSGSESARSADLHLVARNPKVMPSTSMDFCASDSVLEPLTKIHHSTGYGYSGWHSMRGIFVAAGPGVRRVPAGTGFTRKLNIMDIAPTLLHLFGCSVPADMDGSVIQDIFQPKSESAAATVAATSDWTAPAAGQNRNGFTPEQEMAITERLRALGYL